MIKAGAGKAKINFQPEDFPLKAFTGEHDALHVRTLLLEAEERILLVSIELTSLPAAAILHFKETAHAAAGINPDNILISVTHHFSGPHIPPAIKDQAQQRLSDLLYKRIDDSITQSAAQAMEELSQVSVHFGKISCCLNVNRNIETPEGWWTGRNEDAPSDRFIRVVSFDRTDSTHLGILYSYDVQSSVMDQIDTRDGRRLTSSDFIGMASARLEEYYGRGFTSIFLPGAAGDQAPILRARSTDLSGMEIDIHEDGFILCELMSQYMAERIKKCLCNPDCHAPGAAAASACGTGTAGVGTDRAGTATGAEATSAAGRTGTEDKVDNADMLSLQRIPVNLPGQVMKYSTKELRPHTSYSFENTKDPVPVEIIRFNIQDITVLATQPELNSSFGQKIRGIIGDRSLIATLVDGAVKYLPEETDFERITYTAMNTGIGRGADKIFLQALGSEAHK